MFNRRGSEVVDFTAVEKLKKRKGLSHANSHTSSPSMPSVGGFLDFTSPAPQSNNTVATADSPSTLGFLSDFAQASSSNSSDVSTRLSSDSEVSALRIKIDDLEFKLDRLLERLSEMETKISRV